MPGTDRLRVDLFDDPSWGSEDGKAYDRMAVSGFSARTETVAMLVAIGMFALSVALFVLFVRTAIYWWDHLFDGLKQGPLIKMPIGQGP